MDFLKNLPDLLKYGITGFGAFLSVLSFYLLLKEQEKDPVRKEMLRSIYIYMCFSLVIFIFGLIMLAISKKDEPNVNIISKSGFEKGALNGSYSVYGTDVDLIDENFRTPRHHYKGIIQLNDHDNEIVIEGDVQTLFAINDSLKKNSHFKFSGVLNDVYIFGKYTFGDGKINGMGTGTIKFNYRADTAKGYLIFRPTTGNSLFGLARIELYRN